MAKTKKRTQRKNVEVTLSTASHQGANQDKRISFDYEKSNYFRVIHVDGAIGSPTPKADGIQIGLFSERIPIPKSEEYRFTTEGKVGERTDRKSRSGIFREVEVEAILSLETARRLRDWLSTHIETVEKMRTKGGLNA